jgi:hypothetical protein
LRTCASLKLGTAQTGQFETIRILYALEHIL